MLYSQPASNAKINLERHYRRYVSDLLIVSAMELAAWWTALLCAVSIAAYFVSGEPARVFLIAAFLLGSAAAAAVIHFEIKRRANLPLLCLSLEARSGRFRDLLSAWQLSRSAPEDGVSEEMKEALFRGVQKNLDGEAPLPSYSAARLRFYAEKTLILGAVLLGLIFAPPHIGRDGLKRLAFGDQREFDKFVKVEPKNGRVPSGSDALVRAELLSALHPYPKLQVESSGRWQDVSAESEGPVTAFKIRSVLNRVRYRVLWNDLIGGPYQLQPIEWPYLADFKIKLIHPAYTELPEETMEGEPHLNVLRGTKILLSASATKDLERIEISASNGIRYPAELEDGRNISAEFTVLNPFDFHFEMTDREGIQPDRPVTYRVAVREDRYPEIRLLAPSEDLAAGRESRIPFTFEIKDDMGVSGVYLNVRDGGGRTRKVLLKKYKTPPAEKIDEAQLDLSAFDAAPGTVLQLQLEAQDNDTVSGPKTGLSQTISIEIQSYEAEHKKIEGALESFRNDLLSALAQQTLARKSDPDWKQAAQNPAQLEQSIKESARQQSESAAKTQAAHAKLSEILEQMSQDPLTGYDIYAEHRAMQEALKSIREGPMERAARQFSQGRWSEAAAEQDQAIAELERIADISEEVMKHNTMKDLVHSADRLEQKGKSLEESLAGAQSLDPKLTKELRETLNEAMQILSEIQKQLQDLPQELPDDFVNQAAMKNLDMNEMAQSADALNRALQSGDLKSAMEAARDLLKKVKAARDAISKSAEDTPLSGKGDTAAAMQEKAGAMDALIDKQEALLRKTLRMEGKRKEAAMEAQRKMLQELARRQKVLIERAKALGQDIEKNAAEPGLRAVSLNALGLSEPKMQSVLREFEAGNVLFSQKWLKEIIEHWTGAEPHIENFVLNRSSSAPDGGDRTSGWKAILGLWAQLRAEEQDILERLKDNSGLGAQKFSEQDKSELNAMAEEQKQIAEQNKKLRAELSQLASQSAQIKPEIMESLRSAGSEMQASEGALKSASTPDAAGSQERALSHLRKGQEGLQSAQSELQKIKQSAGSKPSLIQPRNQPGGQKGSRTGSVRIPGAEEYLPPKEFREEILESLKEKYPQSQEETIKQYFKKITQ